ncbi:MAG: hypothetical protein H7A35_03015 [Planctomycetales bacterium]|nr:hypothetical protein [bacterium]UNM09028.1 MAG: hypothetical protein H7A35_03015 [Planctomycetales bacterium]
MRKEGEFRTTAWGHVLRCLLAVITGLLLCRPHAAACAELSDFPDYLTATGEVSLVADQYGNFEILTADFATLRITSLSSQDTIVVNADRVEFHRVTGEVELYGNVSIGLDGEGSLLQCEQFSWDPLMEQMEVSELHLNLPLNLLLSDGLPEHRIRARFSGHLYETLPELLILYSEDVQLDFSPRRRRFELRNVQFTHSPHPDPDLFFTADEVNVDPGQGIQFINISLIASGHRIFSLGRLRRNLQGKEHIYGFGFPEVRIHKDVGFSWKQPLTLRLGELENDLVVDFQEDRGILMRGESYVEPFNGMKLGALYGQERVKDYLQKSYERRDDFTLFLSHEADRPNDLLEFSRVDIEYGNVNARADFNDPEFDRSTSQELEPPSVDDNFGVEDRRLFAEGEWDFRLVQLSDDVYLASGIQSRYVNYNDADQYYTAVGGEVAIIYPEGDFNHYLQYRLNAINGDRDSKGRPLMGFDAVRRQELDFATQFHLHRRWRHVFHGTYDIDREEFDKFEVGALRRQHSYEIGMYWDFVRESAGLEFGLVID